MPHYASQYHLLDAARAPEPHDAYADAPFHPPNEWVFQEDRKPRSCNCSALYVLQLLSRASNLAGNPCDGSWHHRPCVVYNGSRGVDKQCTSRRNSALRLMVIRYILKHRKSVFCT